MGTRLILQDIILNYLRRNKIETEIISNNGITFTGIIQGFDDKTIILDKTSEQILLYKSNIIAINSPEKILNTD